MISYNIFRILDFFWEKHKNLFSQGYSQLVLHLPRFFRIFVWRLQGWEDEMISLGLWWTLRCRQTPGRRGWHTSWPRHHCWCCSRECWSSSSGQTSWAGVGWCRHPKASQCTENQTHFPTWSNKQFKNANGTPDSRVKTPDLAWNSRGLSQISESKWNMYKCMNLPVKIKLLPHLCWPLCHDSDWDGVTRLNQSWWPPSDLQLGGRSRAEHGGYWLPGLWPTFS